MIYSEKRSPVFRIMLEAASGLLALIMTIQI